MTLDDAPVVRTDPAAQLLRIAQVWADTARHPSLSADARHAYDVCVAHATALAAFWTQKAGA